jgi:hypothetical protein
MLINFHKLKQCLHPVFGSHHATHALLGGFIDATAEQNLIFEYIVRINTFLCYSFDIGFYSYSNIIIFSLLACSDCEFLACAKKKKKKKCMFVLS